MKTYVIAEIGCNHKGDIAIAREMIRIAKSFCDVDKVKFQKRNPIELLTPEEYNAPHPDAHHAYGETYGKHREALEFSVDQHRVLVEYCQELNVEYGCSVWDVTSAKEIVSINPKSIKIPSAINLNSAVAEYICDNYGGEIHVSFGMTTKKEEEIIIDRFIRKKRNKDLVIYSCVSGYPVPFEDISLLDIKRLAENYGTHVKAIGFSGHHLGIAADIAALALGARYFERHFTMNRAWKGTDHAASLEPDGLRRLVRDIRNVSKALAYKQNDILESEKFQRNKLKRGAS